MATLANGEALPNWLNLNPTTGVFSGTPRNDDVGVIDIKVTAKDGSEALVENTFQLTINNINDGPIINNAIASQFVDEDSNFSLDISGNFSDVDAGDNLNYTATLANGEALPNWLNLNPTTGVFSGTPRNDDVGSIEVKVTAKDGSEATVENTFQLTINNTNDAPILNSEISPKTVAEDSNFSLDVSGNFTDVDAGDNLNYMATLANGEALPNWLNLNPTTGVFSGTPANDDVGVIDIKVTAKDGSEALVENTFQLTINNTNDAPILNSEISPKTVAEDSNFSLDVSGNFTDVDAGDNLNYMATLANGEALPNWLNLNPTTGVFSGTPRNDDVGVIDIKVTAKDGSEALVENTFQLTINNINDGPIINNAIASQFVDEDSNFSLDISGNFSDVDAGDNLNYTATLANGEALPNWLNLNPTTGVFSGTPRNDDVGSIEVKVTAKDGSEATVENTFKLTVNNTNTDSETDSGTVIDDPTNLIAAIIQPVIPSNTAANISSNNSSSESSSGADILVGDASDNIISALAGDDIINMGDGNDWISGNQGNDTVDGGNGNDTIYGGKDNDLVFGSAGDDWLNGNLGDDFLNGGEGKDTLFGGQDNDTLTGGSGDDWLNGNLGFDFVEGGEGNDIVYGGQDGDTLTGGTGNDTLFGNIGNDLIAGNDGNDLIYGGKDNDTVSGNQGNDTLYGDMGNDIIDGDEGNDLLEGGEGNDLLIGAEGTDTLTGNQGSDRFLLRSGDGSDLITDFTDTEDLLILGRSLTFAQLNILDENGSTLIKFGEELLTTIENVNASLITADDFVSLF
jgi:Ca2+-binding RTX toxin-like protein